MLVISQKIVAEFIANSYLPNRAQRLVWKELRDKFGSVDVERAAHVITRAAKHNLEPIDYPLCRADVPHVEWTVNDRRSCLKNFNGW